MSNNMYKKTFEQFELSEECLRKVKNMKSTNKKTRNYRLRYVAVVAIVMSILVGINIISYAATGTSIPKHIKVYFESGNKREEIKPTNGKYKCKEDNFEIEVSGDDEALEKNGVGIEAVDKESGDIEIIFNNAENK